MKCRKYNMFLTMSHLFFMYITHLCYKIEKLFRKKKYALCKTVITFHLIYEYYNITLGKFPI